MKSHPLDTARLRGKIGRVQVAAVEVGVEACAVPPGALIAICAVEDCTLVVVAIPSGELLTFVDAQAVPCTRSHPKWSQLKQTVAAEGRVASARSI